MFDLETMSGGLPTVVTVSDGASDAVEFLALHGDALREAIQKHGALLFRGLSNLSPDNLEATARVLTPSKHDYIGGGSPRTNIKGGVFTSTEYPAEAHLPLHIEASYLAESPRYLWFYCDVEPSDQGETPLGDMRQVLAALDPEIVERFAERGLVYVQNLHGGDGFGKSWKDVFQTDDREQVDQLVIDRGFDCEWRDDGSLQLRTLGKALGQHSETGQAYWHNQAVNWHVSTLPPRVAASLPKIYDDPWHYPKNAFFADGSDIPDEDVAHIMEKLLASERTFAWRKGDLMLVDNQAIAHGRRPVVSDRRILVVLA